MLAVNKHQHEFRTCAPCDELNVDWQQYVLNLHACAEKLDTCKDNVNLYQTLSKDEVTIEAKNSTDSLRPLLFGFVEGKFIVHRQWSRCHERGLIWCEHGWWRTRWEKMSLHQREGMCIFKGLSISESPKILSSTVSSSIVCTHISVYTSTGIKKGTSTLAHNDRETGTAELATFLECMLAQNLLPKNSLVLFAVKEP